MLRNVEPAIALVDIPRCVLFEKSEYMSIMMPIAAEK